MYVNNAKLNRCKKLLETPVKVDRNKEPPRCRLCPYYQPDFRYRRCLETPPSEESRFGRRKSSARRWVV